MLNNFGANYSMSNLNDEGYLDLIYLQTCLNAVATHAEMQSKKANFVNMEKV
jgi:hypothetical protein